MNPLSKIIVGISGGIDSAVTALQLKAEGYEVIGCHFAINPIDTKLSQKLDLISEKVGIPIEIKNVRETFNKTVISYFRDELMAGRSPSPCAFCNPLFKWKLLIESADLHNAQFVASGHYVNKLFVDGNWYIQQGTDQTKDQSYYFWKLNQEFLSRMMFPLGKQSKTITKEIAKNNGLGSLIKEKESTGLCFSEGLPYPDLIKKYVPESGKIPEGEVIDSSGKNIGKHKGYIYYTIGQKRDLEFFKPSSLCVIAIDATKNQLVAGSPKDLWKNEFNITDANFIDYKRLLKGKTLTVKIRGFGWNPDGYCKLEQVSENRFTVKLDNPAWAPAPGQPAVFYEGEMLVGGAIIT